MLHERGGVARTLQEAAEPLGPAAVERAFAERRVGEAILKIPLDGAHLRHRHEVRNDAVALVAQQLRPVGCGVGQRLQT